MTDAGGWRVELCGSAEELALLVEYSCPPAWEVRCENERTYYLVSEDLASCPAENEVWEQADLLLKNIRGAIWVERGVAPPIEVGGVVRVYPDGQRSIAVRRMVVWSIEAPLMDNSILVRDVAARKRRDPLVAEVMRYLDQPVEAFDLYKVFEIVRRDVGGAKNLDAKGWYLDGECRRFAQSVNNPKVLGDKARHSDRGDAPPDCPMTMEEASNFIRQLTSKWLGWKDEGSHE